MKTDLKQIKWQSKNWLYLAQAKDKWWAVVNMVEIFQFHKTQGIS